MTKNLVDTLPICQALSKQSKERCKNFSVKGKRVCHIHGGKSTGAKTKEGKLRQKMGRWKHGLRSKEAKAEAKELREFMKACKQAIN
jgi:23S rRNA maturation-related 3'-5' exoribonuclease YhaM